jgi:hypothetical protein
MDLVYKIFKMKNKLFLFVCVFVTNLLQAQTIPIGTIIKGKRLPSVFVNVGSTNNPSANILEGAIKLNDSKLSIIETGFVLFENSNSSTPNINNSRRVIVSAGVQNFSANIDDLPPTTTYKIRAYAINAKNEIAYSDIFIRTTELNYCYINPCKNRGTCISTFTGPLCQCTTYFCGPCCSQLDSGDITCVGGDLVDCPNNGQARANTPKKLRTNDPIIDTRLNNNTWSLSSQVFNLSTSIPTL